jgi:hypothetical protein
VGGYKTLCEPNGERFFEVIDLRAVCLGTDGRGVPSNELIDEISYQKSAF